MHNYSLLASLSSWATNAVGIYCSFYLVWVSGGGLVGRLHSSRNHTSRWYRRNVGMLCYVAFNCGVLCFVCLPVSLCVVCWLVTTTMCVFVCVSRVHEIHCNTVAAAAATVAASNDFKDSARNYAPTLSTKTQARGTRIVGRKRLRLCRFTCPPTRNDWTVCTCWSKR